MLRSAQAAAVPLHDKMPKRIGSGIDEALSLQVAAIDCRLVAARPPLERVERLEGMPQLAAETADRRRLLLENLVFEDVLSRSRAHHDHLRKALPTQKQYTVQVLRTMRHLGASGIARENSMKLAGKIALITGGSRGIGRATALAFANEGVDVAFCHLADDAKADETAAEIRALGRRALHQSVDVADIAAGRAFAEQAARELGPIDILFNNAGMNIRKPFEAYSEAEFDRILAVHLKGMFFMAQAVYPAMVARGQGCIINVASQRGLKGAVNSAPYSAAKAAIMGFTRALAWEATPKGVRVNAIAPGPVVTDLTATMTPADRQAFIDALPVGRFGRPEEIAATALLLAGPDGGFYVGATLSPNGGDVMY